MWLGSLARQWGKRDPRSEVNFANKDGYSQQNMG